MNQKRNFWPLLFIGLFGFTLIMIIWTIYQSMQIKDEVDDAFMSYYQSVDKQYNNIANQTNQFLQLYDFLIVIDKKYIPLDFKDLFLRQSAKNKEHASMLHVGKNEIRVLVKNKQNNFVQENAKISAVISSATSSANKQKIIFSFSKGFYSAQCYIPYRGNYNITGFITINDKKSFFYLKTNAP